MLYYNMCFNYKISLFTFILGVCSSLILIKYGNSKYKIENTVFGIFLIFIASIQFMDFLFWIDLDNKLGINKITTILGPLLNAGQPIILYIIKLLYFRPNISIFLPTHLFILVINMFYFIYLITVYYNFLSTDKLITSISHGHLKWPWLKYYSPIFYLIVFALNIFYLTNFTYSLVGFLMIYLLLYLSVKYFSYNPGELWCFFGSFIPIFLIIASYVM